MRPAVVVANGLTLLRLLFTPVIAVMVLRQRTWSALAIFACAALSDVFDGWVARRYAATSRFGAYLDPVVDKVFLSLTYVCLAVAERLPVWLAGIVLGRDAVMLLVAPILYFTTSFRHFTPAIWGKLSTALQATTAAVAIAQELLPVRAVTIVLPPLFGAAAAATVWAGIYYLARVIRYWLCSGGQRRAPGCSASLGQ